MEYTKDVIFNVHYGQNVNKIKMGKDRWTSKLAKIYKSNKFIITTLLLTTALIILDLWMVSNFINLFVSL